jgi:hypothetical protein
MKPMTHNQYVHYLIQQMDKQKPPEQLHAAPRRKNMHNVADATPSAPAEYSAVQAINEATQMKALSIRQPYAGLIIAGIKNVENRSWSTKYTGLLVIVSTAKPDALQYWEPMRARCKALGVPFPEELCKINGAALGVVSFAHLVWTAEDGLPITDNPRLKPEQVKSWWSPDKIGFILEHPRQLLSPVPVTGRLGLFNLAEDIAAQIIKQLQ